MRKYSLNENYFENINSEDTAYFFGFLMADGYNNEKRGVIELSSIDKDILEKFNTHINSSKPIRHVVSGKYESYRIDLCSRKLSNDLSKLGCVQNKSLILEFPVIDKIFLSHFIRGYFDGDGCMCKTLCKRNNLFGSSLNSVITFTSTENFCNELKNIFKEKLNINSSMLCRNPKRNNTNRTLQISGNIQFEKLSDYIYNGANIYVDRKYKKLIEIKNNITQRRITYKNNKEKIYSRK